jgi:Type III flagellar switch regulator (C-ring) FliN C-term
VLRKKIEAGGGLPPVVRQCDALWASLSSAISQWSQDVYGLTAIPAMASQKVLTGSEPAGIFGSSYAFVSVSQTVGPVVAVAINPTGARQYAATRLRQDVGTLKSAPDLFLRLMSEHAARALWTRVVASVTKQAPATVPHLADFSASGDAFGDDTTYLSLLYTLGGDGGEDSWLMEGDEEGPEIRLVLKLDDVKKLVRTLQENVKPKAAPDETGRDVLRKRVRNTTVVLDAVLESMPMTIGECSELEVGQVLALPNAKMDKLVLNAGTVSGSLPISQGELGAWKGFRALKLRLPVPEDVIREIAEI